jgi:Na+/H+ antiporter
VTVGSWNVSLDVREFVNSGLMALFFLVVGLEARREFDVGELRVRSRLTLPLLVGVAGMAVPIAIFLVVNAGHPAMHGWGMAMSTDTAFALGALALVGRRLPDRVRTYLLTFSVVDDLTALVVIAIFYSGHIQMVALAWGIGFIALVLVLRARGNRNGILYLLIGIAAWVAFLKSGVDPIVVGLVFGLLTYATRRAGNRWNRHPRRSGSSASSPPPNSPSPRAPWCAPRSRRTTGWPSSSTPGPATSSCRCSRWPTRASC